MASASDPALSEALHMPAGLVNVLTNFVPYDQQAELTLGMARIVKDLDARRELLRENIEDLRAKIDAAEVQQKYTAELTSDCEAIRAKMAEWIELAKQDRAQLPKCGQVEFKPAVMVTVAEVMINEMLRNPDLIHHTDRLMSCYYLILAFKLIFKVVPGWNKSHDFMFIANSGCPSCKSKWCSSSNPAEHGATCSHRYSGFLAAFRDDDPTSFVDETMSLLSEMPAEDDYASILMGPMDGKRRPSRMGGGAAKRACVSSN